MCNISIYTPGIMPDLDSFKNVVWNNPHGYGLLIEEKGNQLKLHKECLEEGTDPEILYELLDRNKKKTRYLHVRWATVGEISLDNTQPFLVYDKDGHIVWFMHNGTFHNYRPATVHNSYGVMAHEDQEEQDPRSDTSLFCERVLKPYSKRLIGHSGEMFDLEDPFIKQILEKEWPGSMNKGVLISNKFKPLIFSKAGFSTIKSKTGEFLSSNENYYKTLSRGPIFDKMEKARKEREEKERASRITTPVNSNNGRVGNFSKFQDDIVGPVSISAFKQKYSLDAESLRNIYSDWDMYEPNNYINLGSLSIAELSDCVKKASIDELTYVINMLCDLLADAGKEILELRATKEKSTSKITELQKSVETERKINADLSKKRTDEQEGSSGTKTIKRAAESKKDAGTKK